MGFRVDESRRVLAAHTHCIQRLERCGRGHLSRKSPFPFADRGLGNFTPAVTLTLSDLLLETI